MQRNRNTTPRRDIEDQIKALQVFGERIADLRNLLAEEWQVQLSPRECASVRPANHAAQNDASRNSSRNDCALLVH